MTHLPQEPQTRDDWQIAANAAEGALALDSARKYGLVTGGPNVDVNRCVVILDRAREEYGIVPARDSIERFVELVRNSVLP